MTTTPRISTSGHRWMIRPAVSPSLTGQGDGGEDYQIAARGEVER
jgi:hypothetical protein